MLEEGYAAVTYRNVAAKAGVSLGADWPCASTNAGRDIVAAQHVLNQGLDLMGRQTF